MILPALIVFVLIVIYYFSAVEAVDNGEMCTGLDKSFLDWVRSKQNSDPKTAYKARKRHRLQLETVRAHYLLMFFRASAGRFTDCR